MILLVAGPESTGTRVAARALGQHPDVLGPSGGHADVLDAFWQGGDLPETNRALLTRRSLPAAAKPGTPARYMEFPDLTRLVDAADGDVRVAVTSREPMAAIRSAAEKRASAQGSVERATAQYTACYRYLFDVIRRCDLTFVVTSLEGFKQGGSVYTDGVGRCLGLSAFTYDMRWVRA